MDLRKSHDKKRSRIVRNSGLFGVIDRAESTDQMKDIEANFPISLNFKAQKLARDAMLEVDYKKAYAIAMLMRMHLV